MSAVHVQPLQNVLNAMARIIMRKQKFDHITADLQDHLFSSKLSIKCVCWSTSVYMRQQQPTLLTWSHQFLQLLVGDISVLLYMAIWQYRAPEWRDTIKEASLFLVQPYGTHCANHVWPITDTDSVLCSLEDHAVLQSLWNTTIASPWQFML